MNLKELGKRSIYYLIHPLIVILVRFKISPNVITTVGLIINVIAASVLVLGAELGVRGDLRYVGWAGGLILFGGLFDMIDGQLARVGNSTTKFGAFYDSVLDRYSEFIMFLGINYYLISHDYFFSSLFAFIALIGSMMVSYTRSRAESLGVDCSVGLMQRPERIILIGFSALFCGITAELIGGDFRIYSETLHFPLFETISIFTFPIAVIAVLANITAIKRLNYCKNELKRMSEQKQSSNHTINERVKIEA